MQRKHQFNTSAKKRTFFDRKVITYGYSRSVSMGKVIPADWTYVRVTIIEQDKSHILVAFDKLLGADKLACYPRTCTRTKQDT